jgi:ribosomal protein L11 methylase PrmA
VQYVPTSEAVVEGMLALAGVDAGDRLFDLGSGDGRIVIAAALRHGARGVGVDIDPARVAEARRNARAAGVEHLVEFREGDLFAVDLRDATVVTLYLLPDMNERLRPKLLAELRPGARVVSHAYPAGDWTPDREVRVDGRRVYLWTVPERAPARP